MVFTGEPERDKISPKMKTAAAQIIINGSAGGGLHGSVDFMPLRSDVNGAASLMSCPHVAGLNVPEWEDRLATQGAWFLFPEPPLACPPRIQNTPVWILASRSAERRSMAPSQSKQDVNVIISYSSSSKLSNRCYNQISGNFLKGRGTRQD